MRIKEIFLGILTLSVGINLCGCSVSDKFTAKNEPQKSSIIISNELKETESGKTSEDGLEEDKQSPEPSGKRKNNYQKIYLDAPLNYYDGGIVVVGDAAYEQYTYVEDTALKYIKTVNGAAKKLNGVCDVYDMIIPTSIGVTFPDNKKKEVDSSDQQKALTNFKSKLSDNVRFVSPYTELMRHRKQYIYFRTDHHWTQLGAYYGYRSFCKTKGLTPNKLGDYQKESSGEFLGSFYKDTGNLETLRKDVLKNFYPLHNDSISLEYTDDNGEMVTGKVVQNGRNFSTGLKYCVFLEGDNSYSIIKNRAISDGSSCIIVKESFANALIPFLADHYQRIYVVDYRYWDGNIVELAKEKSVDDVIFINNISMTRNSYLVGKMDLMVQ